jgi:hypothetical protein
LCVHFCRPQQVVVWQALAADDTIVGIFVSNSCCRKIVGGLVAVAVSWFANNGVQVIQPLVSLLLAHQYCIVVVVVIALLLLTCLW